MSVREKLKRALPPRVRGMLMEARRSMGPPPLEEIVLHPYEIEIDRSQGRRLNLVIPSISASNAFGGVLTTVESFLEIGRRCGAELRVIIDDYESTLDKSVLLKCAQRAGVDGNAIEVLTRTTNAPSVAVRANDVFMSHNWWTALNLQSLLDKQREAFSRTRPFLYLIQDYEPLFYPFSSTHMAARSAYQTGRDCWGIFNSGELHAFFRLQGHETAKTFVFEPRLSEALRPYLALGRSPKVKRLLVYGRPSIPRNCYPAVRDGLRLWARNYSDAAAWEVVSAGLPHAPVPLSPEKTMVSLGKLPLTEYAALLRESAVGLSLMASPHPSYPPLEMSHFGVKTVTNSYTCKNLSTSHQNIESLADIGAQSIANALTIACDGFQRDPEAGWAAVTGRPSFLETGPSPFLDDVAAALEMEVWCSSQDT